MQMSLSAPTDANLFMSYPFPEPISTIDIDYALLDRKLCAMNLIADFFVKLMYFVIERY